MLLNLDRITFSEICLFC